jgi:acyl-CoA thioesterase
MSEVHKKGGDTQKIAERISAFNHSEFARLLGMQITDAYDGYARVSMGCNGKRNPNNVAHGGAIFSLADQAFGIAANCAGINRVAVSIHIQYITPATGSLVAVAHRVADNGTYSLFRVLVHQEERIIAEFEGVAIQVPEQSRKPW